MTSDAKTYQPLFKARGFGVHPCDGFVTSVIQRPGDATVQITYWIEDASPDAENIQIPYEHPEHYKVNSKHEMQTSVKLRPDVALQMALNILDTLSKLPDEVRKKYALPKSVAKITNGEETL